MLPPFLNAYTVFWNIRTRCTMAAVPQILVDGDNDDNDCDLIGWPAEVITFVVNNITMTS